MLLSDFSVMDPRGKHQSSCGYCKSTAGSHTYGMVARLLTVEDYQCLIDRGWRRSGTYIYKPNLRNSCCPQYTIRLKAQDYHASKHQRNLINRFQRFVKEGDATMEREIQVKLNADAVTTPTDDMVVDKSAPTTSTSKPKKPPKQAPETDLVTRIHAAEFSYSSKEASWAHRLKIKLEPASYTDEKHAIYLKYQVQVHNDPPSKAQPSNFKNFLVDTPLTAIPKVTPEAPWHENDPGFGSFHQCYYLDDKLIAVSVLDILPRCLSAVYFMYDPDYSALSLGKYSAQREIAFVQELSRKEKYKSLKYYYMGFYIFTCPKMSYKAQYHPSELLDPETFNWIDYKRCGEIIKGKRYTTFENPEEPNEVFERRIAKVSGKKRSSGADSEDEIEEEHEEENEEELSSIEGDGWETDEYEEDEVDMDDATSKHQRQQEKEQQDKGAEGRRLVKKLLNAPPPGWLDPNSITDKELSTVLVLSKRTLIPFTNTKLAANKQIRKIASEYYAAVGHDLGSRMILLFDFYY